MRKMTFAQYCEIVINYKILKDIKELQKKSGGYYNGEQKRLSDLYSKTDEVLEGIERSVYHRPNGSDYVSEEHFREAMDILKSAGAVWEK